MCTKIHMLKDHLFHIQQYKTGNNQMSMELVKKITVNLNEKPAAINNEEELSPQILLRHKKGKQKEYFENFTPTNSTPQMKWTGFFKSAIYQ